MINKIRLLIDTIIYLKLRQIVFRLFYLSRNKFRNIIFYKYSFSLYRKGKAVSLIKIIPTHKSFEKNSFTFLNNSVNFSDEIDWNYSDEGKLWTYNLSYFDFLLQEEITVNEGEVLIDDFINKLPILNDALEPYPISLRGINWIKFLSNNKIERKSIDRYLYCQYRILLDNIEYHLLGNHLLENGFSLLFGGYYFNGKELYEKGKNILSKELEEQILIDGSHFELSPMYHKIILHRLLDCFNLISNNKEFSDETFKLFIQKKACNMLGWLESITFINGTTPRVNDSTENITADSKGLFDYADRLGLNWDSSVLSDSGYRMYKNNGSELFVDVGNIGPDYIPGHSHSDTFSFLLNIDCQPIIVDRGISTYNPNNDRQVERSTSSHNTVAVGNEEQSEVWGAFRVGRRARVDILQESENDIIAVHDGYKKLGIEHQRSFFSYPNTIKIIDDLFSKSRNIEDTRACFHFHPGLEPKICETILYVNNISITFIGATNIILEEYDYAMGYNHCLKAKMLKVYFSNKLESIINWD